MLKLLIDSMDLILYTTSSSASVINWTSGSYQMKSAWLYFFFTYPLKKFTSKRRLTKECN